MSNDKDLNHPRSLIANIKKFITSTNSETIGVFNTNKGNIYFELSDSTPIITKHFVELILSGSLKSISFNHEIENLDVDNCMTYQNDLNKTDNKHKSLEIDKSDYTDTFFLIVSLSKLEYVISNNKSINLELIPNPVIFGWIIQGGDLISKFENEIVVESYHILLISEIIKTHRILNKWRKKYL